MTNYYTVPTTIGAAKIAAAASAEATLSVLEFAVGDANGTPYLPETRVDQVALVNERYRATIQTLTPDPSNASVYIAKCRLPADVGDFEVSEIALIDADDELIYLANYPRTFKPVFSQGAGGELIIKLYLLVTQAGVLELMADPNVITLTEAEGDSRYALKTELDDEVTERTDADLSLSIALAAEITARETAISNVLAISPKAAAHFHGVTANAYAAFNIASITRVQNGGYNITFVTPMQSEHYIVQASASGAGSSFSVSANAFMAVSIAHSENGFSLIVGDNNTDINIDADFVSVVVYEFN